MSSFLPTATGDAGLSEHASFDAGELAVVLSHYDLGVIESVTEFPRGSRRSPKVGIVCERGKFLLKRRDAQRANPDRVRFAHRVQQRLAAEGFPVARLIQQRNHRDTYLQLREHVYELFEFVPAQAYRRTVQETSDAGFTLARFHGAMRGFLTPASLPTPRGDYHDAEAAREGLHRIGTTLSSHDSFTGDDAALAALTQVLLTAYDEAADRAIAAGFEQTPEAIIHSDWHPGNLLFRRDRVAAVLDYDAVRGARRIIDVANGALQFSIIAGGDPSTWPDQLDEERYRAFLGGYESLHGLTDGEWACLPHLMVEALIAECVVPIQATGSVGPWAGYRVLQMVQRKLAWIGQSAERLSDRAGVGSGNKTS